MSAARSVRSSSVRRRILAILAAAVAALLLVLVACGGGGKKSTDATLRLTPPNTVANDPVREGGTVTMALEKNVPNFNPISADGQSLEGGMVLNGIFPATFVQQPDYTVRLNSDLLDSAQQTAGSPQQTIVYKIKQSAVWSDGTPISADDFIFGWQTQNGADPAYSAASSTGYEDITAVKGTDGGKTVTVTFRKPFADWQSLFGVLLPAHVLKAGDVHARFNEGPASIAKVSGGPFVLDSVQANKSITLKRNDRYYGPRAHLDSVVFSIITDSNVEPQALANNEVQVIYPQPQVDLVGNVRRIGPKVTYEVGLGPQFEHVDLNVGSPALAQLPLRKALLTAINRDQILAATVKQFSSQITPLNNRIFVQGQAGYQDNVTAEGLGSGNVEGAKKILTDAGYRIDGNRLLDPAGKQVPALKAVYPQGNPIRQQELEFTQRAFAPLGVQLDIVPTDEFGPTVFGKHDFDVALFGWVGSPFPSSVNASIYSTDGGQNGGQYSNPAVDGALAAAAGEPDPAKAAVQLNEADRQLSRDAVTLPLYQKPTFLAYYGNYGNIRNNTTSVGPTYNIGQWGLKN
ncbi:MAG: glutathione transport system substrate-binding protein [Frankiaceae bacterium]|nr:glutathione transport system substrate-binding protein [Frankiaceae bacterium]